MPLYVLGPALLAPVFPGEHDSASARLSVFSFSLELGTFNFQLCSSQIFFRKYSP